MVIGLGSFKVVGVIHTIEETSFTKKGFPKRNLILEIPVAPGDRQKTTPIKFGTIGDDCGSLDFYEEGQWVEMLFQLDGRFWKSPEGEEIHFQSLRIVDMNKIDNPFDNPEQLSQDPDDYSPDHLAELAKNVKDYTKTVQEQLPFEPRENDLPF